MYSIYHVTLVISLLQICDETTCVTKCCGPGEELDLKSTPRCLPVDLSRFSEGMRASYENPDEPPSPPNMVVSHAPTCPKAVDLYPNKDSLDNFYLMTDGRLYVEAWGQSLTIEEYCIEVNAEGEYPNYYKALISTVEGSICPHTFLLKCLIFFMHMMITVFI